MMKTSTMLNSRWMVGAVFFLLLLGSCQEEGLPDKEGAEVALRLVPDDPRYASLPLIDTQWQLIGFVDGKRKRIRLIEPYLDNSFTLIFKEDGALTGYTSTNMVWTSYRLPQPREENKIDLSLFGPSTYAGETSDGYLYLDLMKKVFSFRISSKGLALDYDSENYLLFKPISGVK